MNITNRGRILCLRIKNHAHLFSQANPPRMPADEVWRNYDELEALCGAGEH